MSSKKIVMPCLLITCLILFMAQNAAAGEDWKEKQKQMFSQLPVKPGDVVDTSNWQLVKDILPEPVVNWVKRGEWVIKVGQMEFDYDYNPEWYKLSAQNKGKYNLGSRKEIIDIKTGKFPMFVRGLPFPDADVKNDPDGATKLMHNNNICLMMNNSYYTYGEPKQGLIQWIGAGGHERGVGMAMKRFYYWNRNGGEIPNPNEYMHMTGVITTWPYDLAGTCTLYYRHLDGRDDTLYAYVPAIRRVKRLSGANRSDPQMGSDSTMDDGDGWSGQVEAMTWKYLGDKVMLVPKLEADAKSPQVAKMINGVWDLDNSTGALAGYETQGWTHAPWAYTNFVWVPREVWIVEAVPKDPFYTYGRMILHIDKQSLINNYSIKYSRAGEYWKAMANAVPQGYIPDPSYAPTDKVFNWNGPFCILDERTHHATNLPQKENHKIVNSPNIEPRNFTPEALRTWTK
jgi:hypothetical protein